MDLEIDSADGVHVVVQGRRSVSFAGCDSLGLARHPDVVAAAARELAACGLGASASRTTTGTWTSHRRLERALAEWMQTEDAVLLPAGYMAASALSTALARDADLVLLDDAAHPALRDAATFTGLPVREYGHFDAAAATRSAHGARPLVLTDAVDVTAGRTAPLAALSRLVHAARGRLVVDDAHGIGVLGPRGRGTAAAQRATGDRVHVAGSLSKALGAHGGFVAGTKTICDDVRSRFAAYAGATPIPPSTAAAAHVAVQIASRDEALRVPLRANAARLRRRVSRRRAPDCRGSPSPAGARASSPPPRAGFDTRGFSSPTSATSAPRRKGS